MHLFDTRQYNEMRLKSIRGALLVSATELSQDIFGFSKNPFDAPTNIHVQGVKVNEIPVTDETWLRSNVWLEQLDCSTADWASSLIDEQRTEFDIFRSWLEKAPERFYDGLHLGDRRYWVDRRGDSTQYEYHLKRYAELQKMVGSVTSRACDILFRKVSELYSDIGTLLETILSG